MLGKLPKAKWLLADRGYDADWFRDALQAKRITLCIPVRKSRTKTIKYDKCRYKRGNQIELTVGISQIVFRRLKDCAASPRAMTGAQWPSSPPSLSLQPLSSGSDQRVLTLASVGIGLSISAVSLTMQQAMLYTFMLVMPLMLLSGLLTPIRNMPIVLQIVTYANPLRFGVDLVRRVYLEGATFNDIAFNFIPLLAIAAFTLPLAAWLFRNRLS